MYNTNQMVDRLVLCGITRSEAAQIMSLIDRWRACNGTEWTVKHLKLIKQTIIGLYGSDAKCVSPYVRTKNGHLTGPFRAIERLFLLGQKKALAAMMIYSSYVSKDLTEDQRSKFKKACEAPPYMGGYAPEQGAYLVSPVGGGTKRCNVLDGIPFEIRFNPYTPNGKGRKSAPDYLGKSFEESDQRRSLHSFLKSELYAELFYSTGGFFPEDWDFLAGKVLGFDTPPPKQGEKRYPIGKVSVIQEPGFKARFIANPNRVVQHLLKPLGDFLFNCLRALPNDCTFDQDKAVNRIKKLFENSYNVHTNSRELIYCFDLSNATDLFPLEVQEQVVMNIAIEKGVLDYLLPFLRLFRACARSEWYFMGETIRWSRGQPLGLYPSFAMFALSHNFILYELQCSLGGDFCVLGDDVYIVGDELANGYKSMMKDLGVGINLSKSIVSPNVAEFAGKVILQSDILVPYKWRQVSMSSVRDFLKMWGMEAIPLLPRHLRDWATLLGGLPEPLGLGFNPDGLPMDLRILGLWSLYLDEEFPALSKETVSLASVLSGLPEGSALRYDTESAITRPVKLPLYELKPYLNENDLRAFLQHLLDQGLVSLDTASSLARKFGYLPDEIELPFDEDMRSKGAEMYAKSLVNLSRTNLWNRIAIMLQSLD